LLDVEGPGGVVNIDRDGLAYAASVYEYISRCCCVVAAGVLGDVNIQYLTKICMLSVVVVMMLLELVEMVCVFIYVCGCWMYSSKS
jgi:hypothetical protein